ncbi:uncharacterized protein PV09_05707 [Verruconis gallopava]|uniref:Frequency clock protein n=1 Tax=Verruconis gallopava TaxID=253628 RepID=A0A0D2A8I8_9PEZI|nr:uncharacterized protein PV09_05707 [Verruconis gallopava]KIW03058.1 hypothetical protein PV09_05707 [Verruconis gallopava]
MDEDDPGPSKQKSIDTPPARSTLTTHPRRPPAHRSVSLKHSSRGNSPQSDEEQPPFPLVNSEARGRTPVSNRANLDSCLSSIPVAPDKNTSSGESSNAEKWFEKSNNNVRTGSAELMDNDPPFFLPNSSSETSPDALERERANQQSVDSLPRRTGLTRLGPSTSTSEDFRSVIDDLTIQNKKLKRRLKKYEKLHDAHLNADKLFEIRVHGLPPHKKQELEETLRKFAAGLEGVTQTSSSGQGSSEHQQTSLPPSMEQQLTAGSSLGNVDSAYASASGQISSAQGSNPVTKKEPSLRPAMSTSQQRDIQSYLSDIPQGLLPKPIAMTEKSKKKLIVRRLEQIFAGKGASKDGHQQPMQQEEISQSAARADRSESEAKGHPLGREGAREARIMHHPKRRPLQHEAVPKVEETQSEPHFSKVSESATEEDNGEDSPDQRPTRPLDLDPERAQIPEENIKYLRHLGFSPLEAGSEKPLVDGHGYMYLNVLVNMAQLHTLNVTPEFIRKALEQYSKKLELSADGRKVRWKGGSELTRTSSDGSPDENSNASGQPASHIDKRTKSFLASGSGDGSSTSLSKSAVPSKEKKRSAYVPLLFHQSVDDNSDDDLSEWSSAQDDVVAVESSGLTSSGVRTTSSKKKQVANGPIIFYSKAPFVTDLSGDSRGANVNTANIQEDSSYPVHAVGISRSPERYEYEESKGPLSQPQAALVASDMEVDGTTSEESVRGLSKPASVKGPGSSTDESPDPIGLAASGVGGVLPSDNFALNIKSRHHLVRELGSDANTKNYHPHIRALLAERAGSTSSAAQSRATDAKILKNRRKDLPPSELPPPSYFPISSPDEDEDDDYSASSEEEADGLSDSPIYTDLHLPVAVPKVFKALERTTSNPGTAHDAIDGSEDQDIGDFSELESSESIDMLAHARLTNPDLVMLAEREYDAEIAERLAEDIPAGSSAATAGGGSGFNSPITPDNMNVDGIDMSSQNVRRTSSKGAEEIGEASQPRRESLKRARPSDGEMSQARQSKSPKLG